jgi:peptidoglycan/xylan/chitin deacetylase (PgdA/CDA1 family)
MSNLRKHIRSMVMHAVVRAHVDTAQRSIERRIATRTGVHALRIVNMHGSLARDRDTFLRQLEWVHRHFDVVSPSQVPQLFGGTYAGASLRPKVLFTFDDGLASNFDVAAPLLESFGSRGLFFVCPGFAGLEGEAARSFFLQRIRPSPRRGLDESEHWMPMRFDQMRELSARGHVIGSHTFNHARLGQVHEGAELRHEILDAADRLETELGHAIDHFAWTFAWNAIHPKALRMARERYRYCYSGCAGTHRLARRVDKSHHAEAIPLLWRVNVEPYDDLATARFMYSGLVDALWSSRRSKLAAMNACAMGRSPCTF